MNQSIECLDPNPTPSLIIGHFVADLAVGCLRKRQQGEAKVESAIKFPSLPEIKEHVNCLRRLSPDPRTYGEDGYVLRGSIKTDGHRLRFLSFNLRELQSVRYRRHKPELHPDFRTSTIGGTDGGYLQEVRNVVKTE
ncbi:hypothetical protein DFQ27_003344 [Actinomortierella ambigua]|uniref:Uncharacterized protein n=1 Tax=Actinomortierella ambigua TaxID=1343610 RepID=A0A9P6Q6U0_9FUNG|nr:hypothetical protein DFQ27_003344 [Actinomortierella ambigua]